MSSAIHKCPSCGANLTFDAAADKLSCAYCNSEFSVAEVDSLHEEAERKEAKYDSETHGYHCDNCGAEVVTDTTTSSGFCYYCHSPVIFSDKISGDYVPDYVVPFKITKEQAKQTFSKWVKKFKLVPRGFASPEHLEKITGIYVPYWLADAHANVDVNGVGDVVSTHTSGNKRYTTTRRYRFQRSGEIDIEHVKTIASDKVNQALINSVESNTKGKLEAFSTAYLTGFFSQRYTLNREDVRGISEDKIKDYVQDLVRREIDYSNIHFERNDSSVNITKWSYILLPMWILTYNFKDKVYVYALNGENGESFGELPIDYSRLIIHNVIGFFGLAAALLIGGKFLW